METEAFRFERQLELAQEEHDADSMGGTLITPINGMGFAENHERKQSWASQPLKTLRGPETVRGTMVHLEAPSMVKPRN